MRISVELDDLLRGLDHASEEEGIWKAVSAFLALKGIKAYIYHNLPAIGAADYETPYTYQKILNAPAESRFKLADSGFQNLLRDNVRYLTVPRFWCEWDALQANNDKIDKSLGASNFAEVFKGLSIPVHGPHWRNGCFSLEFSDVQTKCEDIDIKTLQWVCQSSHQNLCRLLTNQNAKLPKLTVREKQILTCIALGKSNAEIADILGISFHTVGTYTRRIFVKTNTNNRTSAALFGITNGFIHV